MKAIVIYYSHKGRTANYAREIAMYLWSKGISVSLCSVSDFDRNKAKEADLLLTGCWTCGWFIINQHPHEQWKSLAKTISGIFPIEKTLFFTTYKIRTGSMFRNMKHAMNIPASTRVHRLQSRTGKLSEHDRGLLNLFINK